MRLILLFMLLALDLVSQVRPDYFPEELNPTNENFEVYSQKNGNVRRASLENLKKYFTSEVTLTPVNYIPTNAGNTQNLMSYVTDPNGDVWYIDGGGHAVLIHKNTITLDRIQSIGANQYLFYDGSDWIGKEVEVTENTNGKSTVLEYTGVGLSSNTSYGAGYTYASIDSVDGVIGQPESGNSSKLGGWVTDANNSINGQLVLTAPYSVVIGNSISEGHPALHGRLHAGSNLNQAGQISYYIEQYTKMACLNHGIGGQTSGQIRQRWARDVLGQNVPSLTPSRTLIEGTKPIFVYLHIGINDIYLNVPIDSLKNNLLFFAQSAKENNIELIVGNIGAHNGASTARQQYIQDMNDWLPGALAAYDVTIIDFNTFSRDQFYNDNAHVNSSLFADNVHPSKLGYELYAKNVLIPKAELPVLRVVNVATVANGFNNLAKPTKIHLDGDEYSLTNGQLLINNGLKKDSLTIVVKEKETLTGNGSVTGVSFVRYTLDRKPKLTDQSSESNSSLWTAISGGVETNGIFVGNSSGYKNNQALYEQNNAYFSSASQNGGFETYSHLRVPASKDFIGVLKIRVWNYNTAADFGAFSRYTEIYYGFQWISGNLSVPGITTAGNDVELSPYIYVGADGFLYLRFKRARSQNFIVDLLSWDNNLYNQLSGNDLAVINSNSAELSPSTTNYTYVPLGVNEYQNLSKNEVNGQVTLSISNGNDISFSTLDTDWVPTTGGVETPEKAIQESSEFKNSGKIYERSNTYFSSSSQNLGFEAYTHVKIPSGKNFIGVLKIRVWNYNTAADFGAFSRYTEIYYGFQWISGGLSATGITTIGNGVELSPYMYVGTDGFLYLRFKRARGQNFIVDLLSWADNSYNQLSGDDLTVINSNDAEISPSTTSYTYVPLLVDEYQNLSVNSTGLDRSISISNGNTIAFNVADNDNDSTNEIELPTGGTNGQVLQTDGNGNYSWNDSSNELPTGGTNGQVLQTDGNGNYSWVTDNDSLHTGNGLVGDGSSANPLFVNFTEGTEAGKGIQLSGVEGMKLKIDLSLVPTLRQDSNFVELKFADSSKLNFVAPRDMSIFKVGNSIYFNPIRNFYFSEVPTRTALTVDSLYRRALDSVQMYGYTYSTADSTFQVSENGFYQVKYLCNTSNASFEMFQVRRDEVVISSVQFVGHPGSTVLSAVGEDVFELIAGANYYIEQYSSGGTLQAAKIILQKIN